MSRYKEAIGILTNSEEVGSEAFAKAIDLAVSVLEQAVEKEENMPLSHEEAAATLGKEAVYIVLHNGSNTYLPAFIQEDGSVIDCKVNTELVVVWNSIGLTAPLTDINKRFTLFRYPASAQRIGGKLNYE